MVLALVIGVVSAAVITVGAAYVLPLVISDLTPPWGGLILLTIVLPGTVILLVVPVSLVSVHLADKVHGSGATGRRAGLLALVFAVWAILGIGASAAISYAYDVPPDSAVVSLLVVLFGGPIIAVVVLWWHADRSVSSGAAAVVVMWLLAAAVTVVPALQTLRDPNAAVPLATIDEAVIAERNWRVLDAFDQGRNRVTVRLNLAPTGASTQAFVEITMFSTRQNLPCSTSTPCEPAGTTSAGARARALQDCTTGSSESRPGLIVYAGEGYWRISQWGQLVCGPHHPGLTTDELVEFAELLEPAGSSDEFWAWTEAVGATE